MPKEGYKTVTIHTDVLEKIEAKMRKANQRAGFNKYRNVSHFVEEAVINYEP